MTIALKTLIQFLDDDIQDLTLLTQVLDEEKNALQSRDLTLLEQNQLQKQHYLQRMEQRAQAKQSYLERASAPKTPPAFSLLIKVSSNEALKEKWQTVQSLLERCQSANIVNGKIISHSQRRVGKMMDIVRGRTNQPTLYGSEGKQQSMAAGYMLAKA